MKNKRVLLAMSGGVDSSTAAVVLKEQGYEVDGVTLKLWGGTTDSGCCSLADVEDARRVASQLGINHFVFNLGDEFMEHVVNPYLDAHTKLQTPNPCIECNRHIKFKGLHDRAMSMGYDYVATGHHAQVVFENGIYKLKRGHDFAKDQSYVLSMVNQEILSHTLLPIGHLTKPQVREIAAQNNLRTASKSESMDVCFIQKKGREDFLADRIKLHPGDIIDVDGNKLGKHSGAELLTIGQRRGAGFAVGHHAGDKHYVIDRNVDDYSVVVGSKNDLLVGGARITNVTFTRPIEFPVNVKVQPRAHGTTIEAIWNNENEIEFIEPSPKISPGQSAVCYLDDECIGAGIVI
ncbi:MAG: tRNA 2-thiouridine(34) synthase MnmA [Acidimicrobiia bacterium]